MAKRAIPSVADDFASVLSFLKGRGTVPDPPSTALIEHAKRIHLVTYSLILWRFRLKGLPNHGKVFVEEIASDALQILPQVLMGYGKTAKLLTRGIVENVMRHVYFSDHPVEFERMNRESRWYIGVNDLFDYAKIHPILMRTEKAFDAINRLSTLHSELSAGIHGRQVRDLEMRVALNKIAHSDQAAKKEAQLIERCAASANFLLAVFHRKRIAHFGQEDRRIILRTMPPRARQAWNESLLFE
jgi:hypothetical protein